MESDLDECVLLTALKLENFYIDDDANEELENEIQKRSKAQKKALRKRRESAAIFNRLSEDTSVNFLNDNIDFSRTFFDDGFDDNLTNTSTEAVKNNTDIDKTVYIDQELYEALRLPRNAADENILSKNKPNSYGACNDDKPVNTSNSNEYRPLYEVTNRVNYDKSNVLSNRSIQDETSCVNAVTEQLHIKENAMNSLAHFKEIASKFNVPSQLEMNTSCSTPKADAKNLSIHSSYDAIRSVNHNLYSPIGVHRDYPLKDHGGTPNLFVSNYQSNSSLTSKAEHKKTRTSNLRPPTFFSRLKPPVQRRLTPMETAFYATNNYSEDNKHLSNLSNSKLLRTPSVRPKK
ncbi:20722_t:CDS:2 [Cetraspora pellucida]|uniref:20722_t:CDS:1 n=1 Tax=Cetraspora pellucida TaxID=1433469 RepID=A0A9N9PBL2_9GLOM|nr:20722_t:CDS:2 [Cetraspora pellucida]